MTYKKRRAAAIRRTRKELASSEAVKNASYAAARATAQANANASGMDRGLEWNPIFNRWHEFGLPARQYRAGHELRCEVVMPERLEVTLSGHGNAP